MAECTNCGHHVSDTFVRVFAPDQDATTVECCPFCPDLIRDSETGQPVPARSHRRTMEPTL